MKLLTQLPENDNDWRPLAVNVFCATGEGGGIDPTCSPGGRLKAGEVSKGDIIERQETEHVLGGRFRVTSVEGEDVHGHEEGDESGDGYFLGKIGEFQRLGTAKKFTPTPLPVKESLPVPIKEKVSGVPWERRKGGLVLKSGGRKKVSEDTVKTVQSYIDKLKEMGINPSVDVEIETGHKARIGAYYFSKDKIVLNGPHIEHLNKYGREVLESFQDSGAKNWVSVNRFDHPEATLVHEVGHAEHAEVLSKNLGRERAQQLFTSWGKAPRGGLQTIDGTKVGSAGFKKVASRVSNYAATAPLEFVAEVYTGRKYGKTYDNSVNALYDSLGGPE